MTPAQKNKVFFALLFTGFPITKIPLAMKQISFEVGKTHPETSHNNWSGIMRATWEQGVKDVEGRFSHFNKISDWARAYMHILKNIHPEILEADNINDFAHAVYDSHYTVQEGDTDTVTNYAKGMQRYDQDINNFIKEKIIEGVIIKIVAVFIIIYLIKKFKK